MKLWRSNKPNLKRLNEIIAVLNKYDFGFVAIKIQLKSKIPLIDHSYEYESIEELDETLPVRLRQVLQELGTTYIKLGQTLSTRPDLVGDDFAREFSKLQDDNPPLDFKLIRKVVESELGDRLENLFLEFDEEPLASASIGQVHRAVLNDNREVAVKIQKPGVEELVKTDLSMMKFLAKRIDEFIPPARNYNLPGIVNEFERSILKEIDYIQEVRNINVFNNNFKDVDYVYVPRTHAPYCTPKVMTMELVKGTKVSEVVLHPQEFNPKLIARRGVESYFKQIMIDGFFHADPHSANIYILEDNVICFLDFGMMGILDADFQENLAELFIYFMDTNVNGIINQLMYMDILEQDARSRSLKYDLTDLMYRYYGTELKGIQGGMEDLVSLMRKYGVSLPREFVLMARGIAMLEELGLQLDPEFNAVEILKPMTIKIVKKKFSPFKLVDFIKDNIFEVEHLLKTLPRSINRTLYKIEEGKFTLEVEHKDLERISNKISMALIISALLIGSSLTILSDKGILILGLPFLGVIGFTLSAILGFWMVISLMK